MAIRAVLRDRRAISKAASHGSLKESFSAAWIIMRWMSPTGYGSSVNTCPNRFLKGFEIIPCNVVAPTSVILGILS